MLKLSTVIRFFKIVRIFGVLSVVAYFAGFGPSQAINKIKSQFDSSYTEENAALVVKPTASTKVADTEEDLCLPMGERDRKTLLGAAGVDVIRFLEQSTVDGVLKQAAVSLFYRQISVMPRWFWRATIDC